MFVTDQYITYADAITDDGIDYGTGYYLTQEYNNGKSDHFGPFNFEYEVRELINRHTNFKCSLILKEWTMNKDTSVEDFDLFEALNIPEEWENQDTEDMYYKEDKKILEEYGF